MHRNSVNSASGLKKHDHVRVQQPQFPVRGTKF